MENHVLFDISSTKEYLADLLEVSLDEAVSSEPMEVNGVQVELTRVGAAEITPEGKKVDIHLPLKINLKRSAGLFTVEGNGSINLHLAINFDISDKLRLKSKTELVTHLWIEKPILEIGALNIPIETLVNLVLKHHESIITAKIDQSIQRFSDLNTLIKNGLNDARQKVKELDLKGNTLNFDVNAVALQPPSIKDGIVKLAGTISPQIAINSDEITAKPKEIPFEWLTEAPKSENQLTIPVTLDYDFLEGELAKVLQGVEVGGKYFDVVSIDIRGGSQLAIRMVIDEPIKAEVHVTGKPSYDPIAGVLQIANLDVKVNPANFIYKLTAPLVNRFVEGKMEEFFPLKVNEQLAEVIEQKVPRSIALELAEIDIHHNGTTISEMLFEERAMKVHAVLSNLRISAIAKTKINATM